MQQLRRLLWTLVIAPQLASCGIQLQSERGTAGRHDGRVDDGDAVTTAACTAGSASHQRCVVAQAGQGRPRRHIALLLHVLATLNTLR